MLPLEHAGEDVREHVRHAVPVERHPVRQRMGLHEVQQRVQECRPEDGGQGAAAAAHRGVEGAAEEGLLQETDQQTADQGLQGPPRQARKPVRTGDVGNPNLQGEQGQGQDQQDRHPHEPAQCHGSREKRAPRPEAEGLGVVQPQGPQERPQADQNEDLRQPPHDPVGVRLNPAGLHDGIGEQGAEHQAHQQIEEEDPGRLHVPDGPGPGGPPSEAASIPGSSAGENPNARRYARALASTR